MEPEVIFFGLWCFVKIEKDTHVFLKCEKLCLSLRDLVFVVYTHKCKPELV